MRNMSFALTTRQFLDGTKDVTRRMGWSFLRPGEHFMAVEKGMGIPKGCRVVTLGECVCISNDRQKLYTITQADVVQEGFPDMTPKEFVSMFCQEMDCEPDQIVNRIEFRRIPQ